MATKSRLRTQRSRGRRLVLAILFICIGVSVYWLVSNHERVRQVAVSFFQAKRDASGIEAMPRGVIYDRNLKELAVSMDRVSVYAIVRELESPKEAAMRLAPAVNETEENLSNKLKGNSLQVWLAENISQDEENAVLRLGIKGIFLSKEKVRFYPQKEKASHFLGYAEKQMGLTGIEYTYNRWLNQYGPTSDNAPRGAGSEAGSHQLAPGHNLILTVDLKIQDILEKFVNDIGVSRPGIRLGAMVMETRTGNVVGYMENPSFDPNRFREYRKEAMSDIFTEQMAIPRRIRLYLENVAFLQAQKEKSGSILPWSVAEGVTDVGAELRLWERLGLNEKTHVDFVAENDAPQSPGLTPITARSDRIDDTVPRIATPLQILTALTRTVNGGIKIIPRMVDPEKNSRGVGAEPISKEPVVDAAVSNEAQQLFADMTADGPLASGFLTGDGLGLRKAGDGDRLLHDQIMVTMIPVKGSELVVMVVADYPGLEPGASGKAGEIDMFAPVKKMIYPIVTLQQVLTNMIDVMTPEEKEKMNYQLSSSADDSAAKAAVMKESKAPPRMPDLQGLSLRKSLRLLKGASLEVRVIGTGKVVEQTPAAGTLLTDVKECSITLKPVVNKNKPGKELGKLLKKTESGNGNDNRK